MLELPDLLRSGDVLVFNDTKVIPAQLEGRRGEASIGATLHKREGPREWQAFLRNAKRARVGDTIDFGEGVSASVVEKAEDGSALLRFRRSGAGRAPVGACRTNAAAAVHRVQTRCRRGGPGGLPDHVRAKRRGGRRADGGPAFHAAAVGRAGGAGNRPGDPDAACRCRHFPAGQGRGHQRPQHALRMGAHRRSDRWRLNAIRAGGGRLIAVGTTSLRLLESAAGEDGTIRPFEGDTAIFITPGYRFKAVDGLITNFHLPRSTLFMLVSALMSLELMKKAYAHAIQNRYRFYSYGDASLLLPTRRS